MEGRGSPKREFKQSRTRNQKAMTMMRSNSTYLLEAIAKANSGGVVSHIKEDGVVRMKIRVRKQDLKQMLGIINGGGGNNVITSTTNYNYQYSSATSSVSVEERLNLLMRKKQLLRSNAFIKKTRFCSWSPELQSIPEE